MDKQTLLNAENIRAANTNKFINVTRHLKDRDFQWLKDDLGLFEIPENWDVPFGDDNRRRPDS